MRDLAPQEHDVLSAVAGMSRGVGTLDEIHSRVGWSHPRCFTAAVLSSLRQCACLEEVEGAYAPTLRGNTLAKKAPKAITSEQDRLAVLKWYLHAYSIARRAVAGAPPGAPDVRESDACDDAICRLTGIEEPSSARGAARRELQDVKLRKMRRSIQDSKDRQRELLQQARRVANLAEPRSESVRTVRGGLPTLGRR